MPAELASNPQRSPIARVRAGERSAFDALYGRALEAVWPLAVSAWPRRADAQGITAAVLTEAFAALPELPEDVDFPEHCLRVLAAISARIGAEAAPTSHSADR
jgi:hypothetical protein